MDIHHYNFVTGCTYLLLYFLRDPCFSYKYEFQLSTCSAYFVKIYQRNIWSLVGHFLCLHSFFFNSTMKKRGILPCCIMLQPTNAGSILVPLVSDSARFTALNFPLRLNFVALSDKRQHWKNGYVFLLWVQALKKPSFRTCFLPPITCM